MTRHTPDLSIVIPVFNESGNIRPLAEEVANAIQNRIRYQLIFVDDCSTDETANEIRELLDSMSFVSSCHHARNLGQSAAIRTGVTAATAQSVVVLDGDGQNDPKDILKMFGHLATIPNLKMVIGERRNRKDTWSRRMSSRVANSIRSHFLGDGVCDTGCGLKAFYRNDFLELPAFDHMHRFLPALMQRQGGRVCSVPVNHRPRLHGKSKYGIRNRLWVGITDMLGVAWLQKRSLT